MSAAGPITPPEMADIVRDCLNSRMGCDIADPADGASFEFSAPATGQRFRVTVTEIPAWSDRMDSELKELAA